MTERVSEPIECLVAAPSARLSAEPDAAAVTTSELLLGERVQVLDAHAGWRRVRAALDGYQGWTEAAALASADEAPTHRVAVRTTLRFAGDGIKRVPAERLPHGARVRIAASATVTDEGLLPLADGGWVHNAHLAPLSQHDERPLNALATALYLGAPYLWGGRTPDGCDCSGLLQSVARATGRVLPRDSGPQERAIAAEVGASERSSDDLVFWPGHVAILIDADTLVHANAHTLSVAHEPLRDVIDRAGTPSSYRRLP